MSIIENLEEMNMDIEKIERLVNGFRKAIEKARDNDTFVDFIPFSNFPNSSCGFACDLLAQYLLENDIQTEYVSGMYMYDNMKFYSHAWLEINSTILIDITADQFITNSLFNKYGFQPCYIGLKTPFYELFEIETRSTFDGLENVRRTGITNLRKIYLDILKFID